MHCSHHPVCPGCPLLDRSYPDQLKAKGARLQEALSLYPHLSLYRTPDVIGAAFTEGYRHRLKLPVHIGAERVAIGLYDRSNGQVLDTPDCPVLAPVLRQAMRTIAHWLLGRRGIHAIDLRVSDATGELQLVIACQGGDLHGGPRAAEDLMKRIPGLTSVAVSEADPDGRRVMGRRPRPIAGERSIEEAIGTTRYQLHPGAFFQADPRNAVHLHEIVRGYVGDAETVLDLYAGVGAYALAMAEGRRRVVAVEEVRQAAKAARHMAPPNVEVVTSSVEDLKLTEPFDVAILNPARRGSDLHTLTQVAKLAERIVYVSCGPEALARDLDILAAHGMRVLDIQTIDLFPQTAEVETVVHLAKGEPRRTWKVRGGKAGSPWHGQPSGAVGRADEIIALVLGDVRGGGRVQGGIYEQVGMVATHSVVRIQLRAPHEIPLRALAMKGHPTAGLDRRTARFFADKAGLIRPFVHVSQAGSTFAPLHGDLVQCLLSLGARPQDVATLSVPSRDRR